MEAAKIRQRQEAEQIEREAERIRRAGEVFEALRVDLIECSETGALIDYVLVDKLGHVAFRIGPECDTTEEAKRRNLEGLGWKVGDRIKVEKVGP